MPVWTCVPQVSNSVAEQEVVRESVVTSVMDMEVFIFSSISFIIKGDEKKKYKNTKRIRKRVWRGGGRGDTQDCPSTRCKRYLRPYTIPTPHIRMSGRRV